MFQFMAPPFWGGAINLFQFMAPPFWGGAINLFQFMPRTGHRKNFAMVLSANVVAEVMILHDGGVPPTTSFHKFTLVYKLFCDPFIVAGKATAKILRWISLPHRVQRLGLIAEYRQHERSG